MDPVVAAALVAGGWTAIATLGTQWLAGRREAARERAQAEREERNQRWDTNRERLIELRALLDNAAVALIAYEKAVEDLRTAAMMNQRLQIEVPRAKVERVEALDHESDELQGRLSLRLGSTHEVTRAFTLASHSLSHAHLLLRGVVYGSEVGPDADPSRDPDRRSRLGDALDKAQGDARTSRQQFFERALKLVGVQGSLRDTSTKRALPAGERPPQGTDAKELEERVRPDERPATPPSDA
jgi:hypothetical protein